MAPAGSSDVGFVLVDTCAPGERKPVHVSMHDKQRVDPPFCASELLAGVSGRTWHACLSWKAEQVQGQGLGAKPLPLAARLHVDKYTC